jgi:hypothetical protein
MTILLSNSDALLVAVPMIGILVVSFFRLDELVGKTKKRPAQQRRQVAGLDGGGRQICLDPDGTEQPSPQLARSKQKR